MRALLRCLSVALLVLLPTMAIVGNSPMAVGHPGLPIGPAHAPALRPISAPLAHPSASRVDPFSLISSEPAPMGITDFGVSDSSGNVQPYSYSTQVFEGTVDIHALYMSGNGGHVMSFQLNTVVVFGNHGTNYSYWIQNVAVIDTSTNSIAWVNNIWNLSEPITTSASDRLTSSELVGNGTVNYLLGIGYWYADTPSAGYPGNGVVLSYPANLTARSVVSEINGLPQVAFTYNDGYGWVTFDNVTFAHGSGWTNYGFVVDGYAYTPVGVFYDAEWDYSSSQGAQHNVASDLNMSLSYWNGHNLESPPSAWNFGSDTAEVMDNVIASLGSISSDGSLYSHVTNGAGALGLLYNTASAAGLTVRTPALPSGTIIVGSTSYDYRGGSLHLTIAGGTYPVALYNGTTLVDNGSVTVVAGGSAWLTLPAPHETVTFAETGLPAGTNWSVTVAGISYTSTTSSIAASLKNGSYDFDLGTVPGFLNHVHAGTLKVVGAPMQIPVAFYPFNYTVIFAEFGLPGGTPWWVGFQGQTVKVTTASIGLSAPNGTHPFTVATVNQFIGNITAAVVTVEAGSTEVDVSFSIHLGYVAGSVVPKNATVRVDGQVVGLVQGLFNISVTPGSHTVEAIAPGYDPASQTVEVTPGNQTLVAVTLNETGSGNGGSAPGASGTYGSGLLNEPWLWVALAVLLAVILALVLRRRRPPRA